MFADLTAAECHRMLAEGGDHVGINRGGSLKKEGEVSRKKPEQMISNVYTV